MIERSADSCSFLPSQQRDNIILVVTASEVIS